MGDALLSIGLSGLGGGGSDLLSGALGGLDMGSLFGGLTGSSSSNCPEGDEECRK